MRASGLAAEFIFVLPPSYEALGARLRARGTESPAALERRLADAGARFAPPRPRSLWIGFLAFGAIGALILTSPSLTAARLRYGVVRKPSAILLGGIIERVTDVD